MKTKLYEILFLNMPFACTLNKIIKNGNGDPWDYYCIQANFAFEKLTGLNYSNIVGKKSSEIHCGFLRKTRLVLVNNYNPKANKKSIITDSFPFYIKNKPFLIHLTFLMNDFFLCYYKKCNKDEFTVKQLYEYKLLNFLKNTNNIIIYRLRLNPEIRFEYINKASKKFTGYTPEEYYNDPYLGLKIIHSEDRICFQNFSKNKKTYQPQIIRWINRNQKIIWMLQTTLPEYDDEGNVVSVDVIAQNITDTNMIEKLKQDAIIARNNAEFNKKFLADISHEIRTFLTVVIGMSEILSKTRLNAQQNEYLNTINHSLDNILEITNQILDYSKIEAGKLSLKPTLFKTSQLFENIRKLFFSICKKNISFNIVVNENLPEDLVADNQRIFQIINNLLHNAVKFTKKGQIVIKFYPEKWLTKSSLIVKIEVIDSGVGINPKQQEKLFIPFSQINDSGIDYFEGTGLGLTICRQLTELLGGNIGVESKPGSGSKFWFTFKAELPGKPK